MTDFLPPDETTPARFALYARTIVGIHERDLRTQLSEEIAAAGIDYPLSFINWALELKPETITTFEQLSAEQCHEALERIVMAVDCLSLKAQWLNLPDPTLSVAEQGMAWL